MEWYSSTVLGEACDESYHCAECEPNGNCEECGSIDGRLMEIVNEYASSCDGCGELTKHDSFELVDEQTHLGLCWQCVQNGKRLPE